MTRDEFHRLRNGESIAHAIFNCRIADPSLLDTIEFYAEDLRLLREIAGEVTTCTTPAELARASPGLLWTWWHAPSVPALALWRARRLPAIATGAVDLSNTVETPLRHAVKRPLTLAGAELAHLNIAISDYEAADLRALAGGATVRTLHPGVDCGYYTPGTLTSTPTVVTVAQVNPTSIHRKGLDRVVAAFANVRGTIPEARLAIVGPVDSGGNDWIRSLAAREREGVDFVGRVSRDVKRDVLRSSWAYMQPSRYEGFGLAVAEAMACGATPVVSDAGSLPEVVGSVGRVVVDPNPGMLAAAVVDVLRRGGRDEQRELAADSALRFASATRVARFRATLL